MQDFLSTIDWTQEQLDGLLNLAMDLKQDPIQDRLHGKSIALMFLNPSMRTRTSFDLGMQQLGGIAIVLQPGKDAWGVEFNAGAIMEGDAEEHIAEVAGVSVALLRPDRSAGFSAVQGLGRPIAKTRSSGRWRSTLRCRSSTWRPSSTPARNWR